MYLLDITNGTQHQDKTKTKSDTDLFMHNYFTSFSFTEKDYAISVLRQLVLYWMHHKTTISLEKAG